LFYVGCLGKLALTSRQQLLNRHIPLELQNFDLILHLRLDLSVNLLPLVARLGSFDPVQLF